MSAVRLALPCVSESTCRACGACVRRYETMFGEPVVMNATAAPSRVTDLLFPNFGEFDTRDTHAATCSGQRSGGRAHEQLVERRAQRA